MDNKVYHSGQQNLPFCTDATTVGAPDQSQLGCSVSESQTTKFTILDNQLYHSVLMQQHQVLWVSHRQGLYVRVTNNKVYHFELMLRSSTLGQGHRQQQVEDSIHLVQCTVQSGEKSTVRDHSTALLQLAFLGKSHLNFNRKSKRSVHTQNHANAFWPNSQGHIQFERFKTI